MERWIVINNHELIEEYYGDYTPQVLNDEQHILRLPTGAKYEKHYRGYLKFNKEEMILLQESGETTNNKFGKPVHSYPNAFASKRTKEGFNLFKRVHGLPCKEIAMGEVVTFDLEVPYEWTKMQAIELIGAKECITVSLSVLDNQYGTFSTIPYMNLNQFGYDVNVSPDFYRFSSNYDANVYKTMIIRVEVTNSSSVISTIGVNVELNEVQK